MWMSVFAADTDITTRVNRMKNLWEAACQFVKPYFQSNLPVAALKICLTSLLVKQMRLKLNNQTSKTWNHLRKPKLFQHHVSLPQTNSMPTKQMRIAVILAILTRSIDRHVFNSTYLLKEESGVREVLLRQAVHNSKKESFCRALLLSMFPDEQKEAAGQRMKQVIQDIMWNVEELLPSATTKTFQSDLEWFIWRACNTWVIMQHIRKRFEPSFELVRLKDFEWQTLLFDANVAGEMEQRTTMQGGRDDELLVVFPRLYIVEKDHEPDPVTPGTVLRRSQSLAAAQELEKQPLSPTFGRATSTRSRPQKPRNLSISVHGNNSSEAQAFLEQRKGPSELWGGRWIGCIS